MTARDTIAAATPDGPDAVITAIRGMSHDELRQLRPDIATLYDAARDTADTRGDYILKLANLHRIEAERDELAAKVARARRCEIHLIDGAPYVAVKDLADAFNRDGNP